MGQKNAPPVHARGEEEEQSRLWPVCERREKVGTAGWSGWSFRHGSQAAIPWGVSWPARTRTLAAINAPATAHHHNAGVCALLNVRLLVPIEKVDRAGLDTGCDAWGICGISRWRPKSSPFTTIVYPQSACLSTPPVR